METSSTPNNTHQGSANGRLWDWRAALLVIALVEISSTRLVVTEWTPFLYLTQTLGFIGVVLGLALGCSNFSRKTVIRLSAGYTLILLPAQLLKAIERTDWLWQDIISLLSRLFISLEQFIKNKPVDDQLFFVSIVTLIYWIIGLSAGYWVTRHKNFLNVVLPSGLAMLTVQAFDLAQSKHVWKLALFIFVALLLLGRMYFLQNRSFWKKSNFLLSDESINDLERGALAVTAIVVFVSWSLPGWVSGIKSAAQAWQDASQPVLDKFSNAVSALDSPYTRETTSGDFYGGELALGQQAATGDTPIFTVDTKNNNFVPIRNYWKGRVYDLYLNGRWENASNSSEVFHATTNELSVEYPEARNEMEYTFISSAKRQNLLYAPEETVWVSASADLISSPISAKGKDVTAWLAIKSLKRGDSYKARALIADPSIEELRSTGSEYPAWVTDRYLQVPAEIAPQLSKLALEITAPYDTAYDKTQAITSYLRKEIEYEAKLASTPPENKDPTLWFLFDYKKGFCMYYASAETLMLRSIGIPARMAVGFVEGDYDELKSQYLVVYKDSHAWPEVYFPGIGWVEFEPTSNQFPIERPETKNIIAEATSDPGAVENLAATPTVNLPMQEPITGLEDTESSAANRMKLYEKILTPALILLTLGLGIFITRRYSLNERLPVYLANQYERRGNTPPRWLGSWARWATLSPIERAFQAINLSLFWLGHPQPTHITSQERAETLLEHLPSARHQVLALLREYHATMYTPRAGSLSVARKAAGIILLKTWKNRTKETLKFLDTRYNQMK